ncbi:hypothetical protein [Rhodoferax sp.]|uniref:hypothetical protein n=1 Tax=Rhodoferax sp. TaxID=50421 RepID=UPI0027491580|nr:hypothetical protein [Rhodoferax sp.]
MKPALQAELLQRYPKFFRVAGKRLIDSALVADGANGLVDNRGPFDEWGIECGDGWFTIVDRLSLACEREIELLIAQGEPQECWPRVAQIKEKFGSLRFYVQPPASAELRAVIRQCEVDSGRTCENCGAPGSPRMGRWRHTYCHICEAKKHAGAASRPVT